MATASDLFTAALRAFQKPDIPEATALLRQGFFENVYTAPTLLDEEYRRQDIWHPGADAEPAAAREYARRYGSLWHASPAALELLREVWQDPLVRAELRSFLNLSKNLLHAATRRQQENLLEERELFASRERIRRTQAEILARLARLRLSLPAPKPRLGLVILAARDPAASREFYRRLLGVEPVVANRAAGGYVEFELEGISIGIHGHDRAAGGDPYGLGPPPQSLGWGALFVVSVPDVERYYENALSSGIEIVDSSVRRAASSAARARGDGGQRYFVVRDPSGYLIELTEEGARGLDAY